MRQQKAFNLRAAKPVLLTQIFINTVFITRGNWKYTLLFKWAGAKMQQNASEQGNTMLCEVASKCHWFCDPSVSLPWKTLPEFSL